MRKLRRASSEDFEVVVGIWERARWDRERHHAHEDDLRHFRDVVMQMSDVWLAIEENEIVGFLALAGEIIDQLHVEPRCQGRGIGTALLDRAKELAPEGLTLTTYQGNQRARAFYEGRGFRAVELGVSPSPESEPEVKYAWNPREPA